MKFKIRRARPEDAVRIRNCHSASIRGLCANDYSARQIAAWTNRKADSYRRAMAAGEAMYVAQAGDRIAGFSATVDGEIRAVYVHPRFGGLGIGKTLLRAVEKAAAKAGFVSAKLSSTLTAHSFYRALGYRTLRKTEVRFRDGTAVPCINMKKRLT
jgi:putative acetyltransferase